LSATHEQDLVLPLFKKLNDASSLQQTPQVKGQAIVTSLIGQNPFCRISSSRIHLHVIVGSELRKKLGSSKQLKVGAELGGRLLVGAVLGD